MQEIKARTEAFVRMQLREADNIFGPKFESVTGSKLDYQEFNFETINQVTTTPQPLEMPIASLLEKSVNELLQPRIQQVEKQFKHSIEDIKERMEILNGEKRVILEELDSVLKQKTE